MTCPKLQPPEDGYFVQDSCRNVFNAACGVKCKPGYKLVGSSVRICGHNGVWSGEPVKCEGRIFLLFNFGSFNAKRDYGIMNCLSFAVVVIVIGIICRQSS